MVKRDFPSALMIFLPALLVLTLLPTPAHSILKCGGPQGEILFTDRDQCPEGYRAESSIPASRSSSSPNYPPPPTAQEMEDRAARVNRELDEQLGELRERASSYPQCRAELLAVFTAGDSARVEEAAARAEASWYADALTNPDPSLNSAREGTGKRPGSSPCQALKVFSDALQAGNRQAVFDAIHPLGWKTILPLLIATAGKWPETARYFDKPTLLSEQEGQATCEVIRQTTMAGTTGNFAFEVTVQIDQGGVWKVSGF